MKKLMLMFSFLSFFLFAFTFPVTTASTDPTEVLESPAFNDSYAVKKGIAEERFLDLYNSIDFGSGAKPAYDIFRKAYIGYLNLKKNNKLSNPDILSCIDFSLPSIKKRLWIMDLKNKKVLFHDLVAHGKNTGGNMAKIFSNLLNSNMSSLGFYVTGERYVGKHGLSLRLSGQEAGFNDMAMERAVVMHGADYVNTEIIKNLGRLGRSFGCPAVSREISKDVINTIADGSALFIYFPDQQYLQNSLMLNEIVAVEYLLSAENSLN